MQQRRPRINRPPSFMGQPSPSLAKLKRMNRVELEEHINRLTTEAERLAAKIDRLKSMTPPPEDQVKKLDEQAERLEALRREAKDLLEGKEQRAQNWQARRGRPR